MAGAEQLYPPSPEFVPKEFAKPSLTYRWRVLLTLLALLSFLFCYLGMMIGAGALVYYLWQWDLGDTEWPILLGVLKYLSLAGLALFFAFLLRGLFISTEDEDKQGAIELTREHAPKLFAFLDRLCDELRTRPPRRVYVSPDTKAEVGCQASVLNLFIPPAKDLRIGLWLVNTLNLSEFKAVLAHELAHISQKATWLGSYISVAYQATRGMVHTRGRLERWLDAWLEQPLYFALPAAGVKLLVFIGRHLLQFAFAPLERCYLSLSRAQELHADQVAASTAGSDAFVNALYKLRFALICYEKVEEELDAAAKRGLYTSDLFFHQAEIAAWLRKFYDDPQLGVPPGPQGDSDGPVLVFNRLEEDFATNPDSTHPSFYERELNVKRCYLRCPIDQRSAWLLFDRPDRLRLEVTRTFYEKELNHKPDRMAHPMEVQRFIDRELEDLHLLRKHRRIFSTTRGLAAAVNALPDTPRVDELDLSAFLAAWPPMQATALTAEISSVLSERRELEGIVWVLLVDRDAEVKVNGKKVTAEEVVALLDDCDRRLAELEQCLFPFQHSFLAAHLLAARKLDAASPGHSRVQWLRHYAAVHQQLSQLFTDLVTLHKDLLRLLARLVQLAAQHEDGTLPPKEQRAFLAQQCQRCAGQFMQLCARARELRLPPLTNVPDGTTCYELLAPSIDEAMEALRSISPHAFLDAAAILKCLPELPSIRSDLGRLRLKCAAAILRLCERIAKEWNDKQRVRQLRESLLQGRPHSGLRSGVATVGTRHPTGPAPQTSIGQFQADSSAPDG